MCDYRNCCTKSFKIFQYQDAFSTEGYISLTLLIVFLFSVYLFIFGAVLFCLFFPFFSLKLQFWSLHGSASTIVHLLKWPLSPSIIETIQTFCSRWWKGLVCVFQQSYVKWYQINVSLVTFSYQKLTSLGRGST